MKFMLMILDDEKFEAALPPAEIEQLIAGHAAFGRELHAAGKVVSANRLRYSKEAKTIRMQDGAPVVHDGPYAESKEVLGGFYLIDVASKDEAIAWAKKLPLLAAGGVEVRPARTGAQWRGEVRAAKQFMLLFIGNQEKPPTRADVFQAIDGHYELSLDLAAQGKFVGSRSLEPSAAASTVRLKNGVASVSDGPFAESKEFVAGYFLIACDGQDEAIDWARQLMRGTEACEVRPVWTM